jgi:hypothetical protein
MFNLIIDYDSTAWEGPGRLTATIERFKEYSGDEAASIETGKPETLKRLESVLTILMYEKGASGVDAHRVRIGFAINIRLENGMRYGRVTHYLSFDFEELGELNQFEILNASNELQLGGWEETRTHWAIKDGRIPLNLVKKAAGATKTPTIEDEVRAMLAIPAENDEVEFKETLHWDGKQGRYHEDRLMDVQKAICAMLNRTGGTILLGVQDTGNKPVGIAKDLEKYKSPDAFQRKIAEPFGAKLKPDPSDLVNVRFVEIDGVTLARVDVRPDRTSHYALLEKVYVRRDGESRELTGPNLAAWAARRLKGEE